MASKHERRSRRKVTLTVEPLEARIAPVIVTRGAPYTFFDAVGGDMIQVSLFGPGQADVRDAGGNDPVNAPIASVMLSGTKKSTRLVISDLFAGDGDDIITGGAIQFPNPAGARMGALELNGGPPPGPWATLQNTTFFGGRLRRLNASFVQVNGCTFQMTADEFRDANIWGQLANTQVLAVGSARRINIFGSMTTSSVVVNGNAQWVSVFGSATLGSTVWVGANTGDLLVGGNLDSSIVWVGGNARRVVIGVSMVNGAACTVVGNVREMFINANLDASTVQVFRDMGRMRIWGSMLNGATCMIAVDLNDLIIGNNLDASLLQVFGDARRIDVWGNVINGGTCWVQGDASQVRIGNNLDGAQVIVGGSTRLATIGNSIINGGFFSVGRDARQIQIGNGMNAGGVVTVGGNARLINVGLGIFNSSIFVNGTARTVRIGNNLFDSTIWVAGSANTISIVGHVDVSVFGNQVINVGLSLTRLQVGGHVGAFGGINVPDIAVGGLRRADVGDSIYGNIHVLGRLGDVSSAGQDAFFGFPPPPGGTPPYNGWFQFRDAGGFLTGGYVEYVTWGGRIVS